ncbi:hypothetical protein TruAng_008776 [Truncatella angustata]|nr:hypothetical protein TruAng_008776 [Truncatella angustata]
MPSLNSASWCNLLAVIGYLGSATVALCAPASGNTSCCQSLTAALSSKVVYPDSAAYNASVSSYWAQGEQLLSPSCIVSPQAAQDVSAAIKILVAGSCKFAVRGGGHGSVTGIANIEDGVTLDLRGINFTTISNDGTSVAVGAGQLLGNAYSILYKRGLYIPTARAASIGAGGSTIGGGLGYLYPKTGFAVDSVVEFEVVLANGTIVSATKSVNSDLWRALKGGGSNFGVVTKIVYTTYPLGDVWGGDVVYPVSSIDAELRAFYNFAANPSYDDNAAVMMNFHWSPTDGNILDNQYIYAKPVVAPPAFAEFYTIPNQIFNSTAVTNIPALSAAQSARSPAGLQEITFAVSFRNNVDVLKDVFNLYNASITKLSDVEGISLSLSFEPLMQLLAAKAKATGGNVLGVDPPAEGVVLTLLSLTFTDADDYSTLSKFSQKLLSDIIAAAKKRGASNSFIDMNHAGASQKVLASYGSDNYAFLKATAKKYDPSAVFQKLLPGGFKL